MASITSWSPHPRFLFDQRRRWLDAGHAVSDDTRRNGYSVFHHTGCGQPHRPLNALPNGGEHARPRSRRSGRLSSRSSLSRPAMDCRPAWLVRSRGLGSISGGRSRHRDGQLLRGLLAAPLTSRAIIGRFGHCGHDDGRGHFRGTGDRRASLPDFTGRLGRVDASSRALRCRAFMSPPRAGCMTGSRMPNGAGCSASTWSRK